MSVNSADLARLLGPAAGELSLKDGDRVLRAEGNTYRVERMPERWRFIAGGPMDLNLVTAYDLALLPGIGRARASRIIAFNRRFSSSA